jgi:hypothetical protein
VWPFGDGEPACCGGSADMLCLLALVLRRLGWWRR